MHSAPFEFLKAQRSLGVEVPFIHSGPYLLKASPVGTDDCGVIPTIAIMGLQFVQSPIPEFHLHGTILLENAYVVNTRIHEY